MVDPSLGMAKHAQGYEMILRDILNEERTNTGGLPVHGLYYRDLVRIFYWEHGNLFDRCMARPEWVERGEPKECLRNSFQAVRDAPHRLVYCEGMAWKKGTNHAVMHAWAITHDQVVIDPTWHDIFPGREYLYWGIPFKWQFVRDTCLRHRTYGVVEVWEENYPILTGKVPVEEYLWTPEVRGKASPPHR